jgi:hypothetical protein
VTLDELKLQKRWLLWRLETIQGKDKPTKVPRQPNGHKASLLNPKHLHTYAELVPFLPDFSGIGLALGLVDGVFVGGVDIDACCDSVTGAFTPESRQVVIGLDSYSEFSPSGTGCHIWVIADGLPGPGLQKPFPGCKQVEVKGQGYYHTFTGRHLRKTPPTLEYRQEQITTLYNRVAAIAKPGKTSLVIAVPQSEEERFQKLWAGDTSAHNGDHSSADFALCILLAKKHNCNAFKVDSAFRESGLYREKWERDDYRENTITRAIAAVLKETVIVFDTEEPIEDDSPRTYLVEPLPGRNDGWFPKREISLIAGSSGTGKTSWGAPLFERIRKGEDVYGHKTQPRDYRILLHDRSRQATLHTLKNLGLPQEAIDRCIRLTPAQQRNQPADIVEAVMELNPGIDALLIEGLDMWIPNIFDLTKVSDTLDGLQRVAQRRNVAIVATMGSPKQKSKDGKYSGRDSIFGSVAFGRKAETVVLFQFHDAEDEASVRVVTVLLRCAAPEKFYLRWGNAGLELTDDPGPLEAKTRGEPNKAGLLKLNIRALFKPGERIVYSDDLGVSVKTFYKYLDQFFAEGWVDKNHAEHYVMAAH